MDLDVRQLRYKLQLTQEQFAVYLGASVSSVRRWEQGELPSNVYLRLLLQLQEQHLVK